MDEAHEGPQTGSPHVAYSRLLKQNRTRIEFQLQWDRRLGYAKIALAVLAVCLAFWFLHTPRGIWPLLAAVALFVALAIMHERVLQSIRNLRCVLAFYERGLARLEDHWTGTGEGGERFLDPAHPYARDLDIFGKGSLFELLCTVRTRAGEETLARWLLQAAPPDEICARQTAAKELRSRTDFRERLFTAGDRVSLGLHPDALIAWAERESSFGPPWLSLLTAALAILWIASAFLALWRASYEPLLLLSFINLGVSYLLRRQLEESVDAVEPASEDLDLLVLILNELEQENFTSPKLRNLQAELRVNGIVPSAAVKKLDRVTHYLASRRNLLIRFFDGLIFYSAQLTLLAESWRKKYGTAIRGWLSAVGEMEALAALSGYAFEHPADAWPEMTSECTCFEAEAFTHPLLPENTAIRNDLKLGDGLQLIILSGPNMAGKSTFVRGIGINAVLAQCGAPVRARRLRMSPLAVGASICILDSLQGGVSRFYAEIKRLKLISDLAGGPIPVLFLLDELLSGTNSHDRLAGTRFVVRALVEQGAMGLVTTHDLALAQIPESMNGSAQNFHFEDHLEDGKLVFDYKLKPGVVQTSNALKLMQSIGLVSTGTASR